MMDPSERVTNMVDEGEKSLVPAEEASDPPAAHAMSDASPEAEPERRATISFIWSDHLGKGYGHPFGLHPGRLLHAYRLLESTGALRWREVQVVAPDPALGTLASLEGYHTPDYIQSIDAVGRGMADLWRDENTGFGADLGTLPFPEMAQAASLYAAAARTAVRQVTSGATTHAISLAGQQPHARPDRAVSGHIFNDVILALQDARAAGRRVAFLNLDAEHPTQVEQTFLADPALLTISMHEGPEFLYPRTGAVQQLGEGEGRGANVNIPLPPGTEDEGFLWAFEHGVAPVMTQFAPDLLVMLGGGSAHVEEPLAHLRLTSRGYQKLVERATTLAPHIVFLGGGGTLSAAVARLWTLAFATLAGRVGSLPRDMPAQYVRRWGANVLHDRATRRLPKEMHSYATQRLQETLFQLQRQLFPILTLPVTVEPYSAFADDALPTHRFSATPAGSGEAPESREVKVRRMTPDQVRAALRGAHEDPVDEMEEDDSQNNRTRELGAGRARREKTARPSGRNPREGATTGAQQATSRARDNRADGTNSSKDDPESGTPSRGQRRRRKRGGKR